jgi:hypothetical protein
LLIPMHKIIQTDPNYTGTQTQTHEHGGQARS